MTSCFKINSTALVTHYCQHFPELQIKFKQPYLNFGKSISFTLHVMVTLSYERTVSSPCQADSGLHTPQTSHCKTQYHHRILPSYFKGAHGKQLQRYRN